MTGPFGTFADKERFMTKTFLISTATIAFWMAVVTAVQFWIDISP
jgi:hypothetical protein